MYHNTYNKLTSSTAHPRLLNIPLLIKHLHTQLPLLNVPHHIQQLHICHSISTSLKYTTIHTATSHLLLRRHLSLMFHYTCSNITSSTAHPPLLNEPLHIQHLHIFHCTYTPIWYIYHPNNIAPTASIIQATT